MSAITVAIIALVTVIASMLWWLSDAGAKFRIRKAKDRALRRRLHEKTVLIAEHLGRSVEYDDPFNLASKGFRVNGAMRYRDERVSVNRVAVWSERHSESFAISYVLAHSHADDKYHNVFEAYGYRDGSRIEIRGYKTGDWEAYVSRLYRAAETKRNEEMERNRKAAEERRRNERDAEKRRFGL